MYRTKHTQSNCAPSIMRSGLSRRSFLTGAAAVGSAAGLLAADGVVKRADAHYQTASAGGCSWPRTTGIAASGQANEIVHLPYSDGQYVVAKVVFNVDSSGVALRDVLDDGTILMNNDTIVTNLGTSYAEVTTPDYTAKGIAKSIPPRKAMIIRDEAVVLKAPADQTPSDGTTSGPVHLAFIRTSSPRNLANLLADTSKWQSYTQAGCWPEGIGPYPLWMSNRGALENLNISLNPWEASNQKTPSGQKAADFNINTNLWWLPAMSDAAVHHCHYQNFMEVHTQLSGNGRMQKFYDLEPRDLQCSGSEVYPLGIKGPPPAAGFYSVPGTHQLERAFGQGMYEEYRLLPGDTNVPFAHVDDDMNFIYPWHQYYADTDCLWVVWELTPVA